MTAGTYSKFGIKVPIKVNQLKFSKKESSNISNGIFKVNYERIQFYQQMVMIVDLENFTLGAAFDMVLLGEVKARLHTLNPTLPKQNPKIIKKLLHFVRKTTGLKLVQFEINRNPRSRYLLHSDIE